MPDNAYGTVVEAAFQQAVARRGGRVVALERYPLDRPRCRSRRSASRRRRRSADAIFIPDGADNGAAGRAERSRRTASTSSACSCSAPACGTIRASSRRRRCEGGWYAAPDPAGFRVFAQRYRARYGQDPVRPATLAYDAVALVAALVKTQGPARFSEQVLTNPSGFAGIDGVFRFRPDGTNERGLAVMRVTPQGGAGDQPGAALVRPELTLGGQIGHHRIEHRKARHRHAQAAVRRRLDHAFVAQHRDARCVERAAATAPRSAPGRCLRRAAGPSADIRRPVRRASAARR